MRITTVMNLEVTFVEIDCKDIKLPCNATDDSNLEKVLKEKIGCNDLHLYKIKTSTLDERVYIND